MYGYQWPEPSRGNVLTNAITFRQGGAAVPTVLVYRHDGVNGDPNFGPIYPFKMRGSIDSSGNVVLAPGEGHVSTVTNAWGVQTLTNSYAIEIPVLTNAPFDIAVRSDASANNVLVKMDGGLDLNSQMGLGPTTGFDRRDNRPGYVSDVWLGYEQATNQFRYGPEKFGARDTNRDNIVSLGAETYYYTVGTPTAQVVNGSGSGLGITTQTATWVYHDPGSHQYRSPAMGPRPSASLTTPAPGNQRISGSRSGYKFQIDTCYIYYTTDGSNPEGAFGVGKGTTQVVEAFWVAHDSADGTIDWWKGTIPGLSANTQVRYKVALFKGGYSPIDTISDADDAKLYGLTQFGITNFNPATATVWLHNDLNPDNTTTGLATGFHIVRARAFLPRSGKSQVYNTFLQTFYYAGGLPGGVIAYPTTDGSSITGTSYTVVVRADSSVTEADYCITDNNGQTCGFASSVSPDSTLSQQYPNYPQEYRFTYSPVASSGTATISVSLKDLATSAYPNRFTTLTRTVQAAAPATVVEISNPATDGSVIILNSNDTYSVQTCFTSTLSYYSTNWNLLINGVLQPPASYIFRPVGAVAGCPGMRTLIYIWPDAVSGTNVIQVVYTNGITLSDTRTVAIARIGDPTDSDGDGVPNWLEVLAGTNPYDSNSFLHITDLVTGNPVELVWSSVPNQYLSGAGHNQPALSHGADSGCHCHRRPQQQRHALV